MNGFTKCAPLKYSPIALVGAAARASLARRYLRAAAAPAPNDA